MNGIADWLGAVFGPDDAVAALFRLLPGGSVFIVLFLVFKKIKDWVDFAVASKEYSVRAYRTVSGAASQFAPVRALLTALAAVALTCWVLGVQMMVDLAVYLLDQFRNWDVDAMGSTAVLHGLRAQLYPVTGYATPALAAALVLLAVNYRGPGGLLGRAVFVVLGCVGNAPLVFIGILTVIKLLGDLLLHGIHLFGQGDNLGWNLAITVSFGLYLATFFMAHGLVGRVREVWGLRG